jgi:hypothetical protein
VVRIRFARVFAPWMLSFSNSSTTRVSLLERPTQVFASVNAFMRTFMASLTWSSQLKINPVISLTVRDHRAFLHYGWHFLFPRLISGIPRSFYLFQLLLRRGSPLVPGLLRQRHGFLRGVFCKLAAVSRFARSFHIFPAMT